MLRNGAGKAQLLCSLGASGPVLLLADQAGEIAASLTFRQEDRTTLLGMKFPGEERNRAVLTIMEDGQPYLRLRGPDGDTRLWAKPEIEFRPAEPK